MPSSAVTVENPPRRSSRARTSRASSVSSTTRILCIVSRSLYLRATGREKSNATVVNVEQTGYRKPMRSGTLEMNRKRMLFSDLRWASLLLAFTLVTLSSSVSTASAAFILGGCGGSICGISSSDADDAAHNETTSYQEFHNGQWYRVRMRATPTKLESWVDDTKIIDVVTTGKKIALRSDV